jgi:nitroimidazol reductase NimA-like FMN-containing flavoprotein (pyridoxamine 5'-phosphate oxidase superfamily)
MTYLEDLTAETCTKLLAGEEVGRIAFAGEDGYPVVLPVNYRLDGDLIVFRTAEGLKLENVPLRRVAFEVDRFDLSAKTGWSLLVRGHAREVTSALGEPYESLRKAPLAPWAPGSKDHWVAVETDSITGRQIVRASTASGGGLAG